MFTGVKPGMRLHQEEVFGPVIAVVEVGDFEEALHAANDVEFGLSRVHLHARREPRR